MDVSSARRTETRSLSRCIISRYLTVSATTARIRQPSAPRRKNRFFPENGLCDSGCVGLLKSFRAVKNSTIAFAAKNRTIPRTRRIFFRRVPVFAVSCSSSSRSGRSVRSSMLPYLSILQDAMISYFSPNCKQKSHRNRGCCSHGRELPGKVKGSLPLQRSF